MKEHIISEIEIGYIPNKLSNIKITNKDLMEKLFRNRWNKNKIEFIEEFKILIMNNSNEALGIVSLSKGGYTGTLVDLRIMFATILKAGGTAFATCHNHPSGTLDASVADKRLAKRIEDGAATLDLTCLDHLIITSTNFKNYESH